MGVYDVRIKRLAVLSLPTTLRKPLVAALAQSMAQGVNTLHGDFMRWRADKLYRLYHNGQVCYLRAVLNDEFDPYERGITITDGWDVSARGMVIHKRETEVFWLVPQRTAGMDIIINRRGFGGVNGYDFWITVPQELRGKIDENRLNAIVNTYKLASKRWAIAWK